MVNLPYRHIRLLTAFCFILITANESLSQYIEGKHGHEMKAHYVEIVSKRADDQIKSLEKVHGLSFGPKIQDLGQARVATAADGSMVGVRAPLAEHEKPIVRVYFEVADINKAVKAAEEAGALVAYPPTKQGETGTWAIYILGGIQHGLWQK